jgi:hypothetical protein
MTKKLLANIILLSIVASLIWLVLNYLEEKPACNCYFPNSNTFGVYQEGRGCQIIECQPRKKDDLRTRSYGGNNN